MTDAKYQSDTSFHAFMRDYGSNYILWSRFNTRCRIYTVIKPKVKWQCLQFVTWINTLLLKFLAPDVQSTDYTTTKKCQSALCTITRAESQVRTVFRWETTFLGWTFSLHYNAWMPDTQTYLFVVLIQFKSNDFLNNSVICILWFSHLHTKQMHYWAANRR